MDHKLCRDCKGFCCDDIGLDFAPHELQNLYHRWADRNADKEEIKNSLSSKKLLLYRDIWLMYPMLVFIKQDTIHPDGEIDCSGEKKPSRVYHYSCKHHNKKTGDCDIYEERPMMCRTFPDNGFCGYRKVTDKRVKACRPKWFKVGMTYHDWYYGMYPEQKEKEEKLNSEDPTEEKPITEQVEEVKELLEKETHLGDKNVEVSETTAPN